jgi:predicted ATPase
MATIIKIRNVGPIKEADLDLNKINVFMGPQSSGKSTVAKIISYCTWVEKRRLLDGEYKEDVNKQLLSFHHLHKNYFEGDSFFEYESEFVKIRYSGKELKETIEVVENKIIEYKKTKNIYIPAERNFVSVVPNLKKYNESNDNILSLVYDWFSAKKNFTKQHSLPILDFGIEYYYKENIDEDMLILKKISKEISLDTGSSGLQSITPLFVILEYLTKKIYEENKPFSVKEQQYSLLLKEKYFPDIKKYKGTGISRDNISEQDLQSLENNRDKLNTIIDNRTEYNSTQFIIEEPEQNLFPETQRDLVYYLLEKCLDQKREHRLTITTHSPYILYALNNCMLGGLVYDRMSDSDKERVRCQSALIDPEKVSIYQIHDGILKPIQQDDGLISANYFDQNMKALMDDFYVFLNYYGE